MSKNEFAELLERAKQGNPDAQFVVGGLYLNGIGTEENQYKAFEWCLKAAQQELPKAQYMTGLFYLGGMGVKQDLQKAYEWITKAATQGFEKARNFNLEDFLVKVPTWQKA